jgi:nucleoside-diphosphate-sugar epimerase
MKVLVTGANGFFGSHLVPYLDREGVEVHSLTTRPATASAQHHGVNSTADIKGLEEVFARVKPDYLIHLAGIAQTPDPLLYYSVNTQYAVAIFHALRLAGIQQPPVLLVGTSAEYGMVSSEQVPITEALPCRPYSHYGISKLAQTFEGLAAYRQSQPVVVVRPFNVIGTGMPGHLALQDFVMQLKEILDGHRAPIIEVGNLHASRDFVDVDEVVKILWKLIRTETAYGQIVNICSGKPVILEQLLDRLIALSGVSVEVRVAASRFKPVDVPVHFGCDIKLSGLMRRTPDTNLDVVLKKILLATGMKL